MCCRCKKLRRNLRKPDFLGVPEISPAGSPTQPPSAGLDFSTSRAWHPRGRSSSQPSPTTSLSRSCGRATRAPLSKLPAAREESTIGGQVLLEAGTHSRESVTTCLRCHRREAAGSQAKRGRGGKMTGGRADQLMVLRLGAALVLLVWSPGPDLPCAADPGRRGGWWHARFERYPAWKMAVTGSSCQDDVHPRTWAAYDRLRRAGALGRRGVSHGCG